MRLFLFLSFLMQLIAPQLLSAQIFQEVQPLKSPHVTQGSLGQRYCLLDVLDSVSLQGQTFYQQGTVQDAAVAGYTPQHQVSWFSQFGATDYIQERDIVADWNDDVIVSFDMAGDIQLPNGTALSNLSGTAQDGLLAKLDGQTGQVLWHQQIGNNETIGSVAVAVDAQNQVYLTGTFEGTLTIGGNALQSAGGRDIFVCKYSSTGQLIWAKRLGGTGIFDSPRAIDVNAQGEIAISSTLDDGNIDIDTISFSFSGSWHGAIIRMDSSGSALWVRHDYMLGELDAVAINDNNEVFAGGNFSNSYSFLGQSISANGLDDMLLMRFSPNGQVQWLQTAGNTGWDQIRELYADGNSGVLALGTFETTVPLSPTVTIQTNSNSRDLFLARYDMQGNVEWAVTGGGTTSNIASGLGRAAGHIWVSGWASQGVFGTVVYNAPGHGFFISTLRSPACEASGLVFKDENADGLYNTGDSPFPNQIVQVNNLNYFRTSAQNGHYAAYLDTGSYQLSMPQVPLYHSLSTPTPAGITFSSYGQMDSLNHFGLIPFPNVKDLRVQATAVGPVRAGYLGRFRIAYENVGTTVFDPGVIGVQYDTSRFSYASSEPNIASFAPGALLWSVSNLQPGEKRYINLFLLPDGMLSPGTPFSLFSQINPTAGDSTVADNEHIYNDSIVNSFDPNDKQVFPDRNLLVSEVQNPFELSYKVRFQNTGNAPAINVVIRDTLSTLLDIPSFEMLNASHDYYYEIEGNVVTWTFPNIMLPDSTSDEPNSHGMVLFRINTQPDLMLGDQILNRAGIYFDFNAPIITNTTVTEVVSTLQEQSPRLSTVQSLFFPNPMAQQATLRLEGLTGREHQLRILDVLGRQQQRYILSGAETQIHRRNLAAGLYFYQVLDEAGELLHTGRFSVRE